MWMYWESNIGAIAWLAIPKMEICSFKWTKQKSTINYTESFPKFDIYLVDTPVSIILLELIDLSIRIRESPRNVPPSAPNVGFNDKYVVKREFLVACAQFLHHFRHRSMLGLRSWCRLGLCRGCIVRWILIHVTYVARPRADFHSVGVDNVIIHNIRGLCWKSISGNHLINRIDNGFLLDSSVIKSISRSETTR